MPIPFKCPKCSKAMNLRDDMAGKKIRCPGCQAAVAVPAPGTAKSAPVAKKVPVKAAPGVKSPVKPSTQTMVRCPRCKTPNRQGALVCKKCGARFSKDKSPAGGAPGRKPGPKTQAMAVMKAKSEGAKNKSQVVPGTYVSIIGTVVALIVAVVLMTMNRSAPDVLASGRTTDVTKQLWQDQIKLELLKSE